MWKMIKKLTDLVLVVGFLVFIFLVPIKTYTGPVKNAVQETKYSFKSYKDLTKKFEGILQKNLFRKYEFINLNGRMARYVGMNSLNKIQKLQNGFLTGFSGARDIEEYSRKVTALNDFLASRGIPFLYLLIPSKNAMYDVYFAPGYGSDSKQNITNMIDALNTLGVNTINMDEWFKENGWHMEDVFFKTDHHWKPEAAIATARYTMELLQEKGIAEYDEEKLREESYKKRILKNWFLGSRGRRTGKYFAGLDDITVYRPKFKTDYFYAGLAKGKTDWKFSNNLLNEDYIKRRNLFGTDPYCIYLHGTFGYHIAHNPKAINKKKVLITGDSYFRAWQCFLATQFQETVGLDLRRYDDGSFVQYVAATKPDVVIMCLNEDGITSKIFNTFGVEEYLATLEQTDKNSPAQFLGDMELQAEKKNNDKFSVVCGNLEPNQTYTLTIDHTALSGAKNSFVQMTLQNLSNDKAIYNRYFEPNSEERQKWIFTTPKRGEDTYGIYLYAGTKGHTKGIRVKVDGIRLRKGILED